MKYILLLTMMILSLTGFRLARRQKEWFQPLFIFSVPILLSVWVNLLMYDKRFEIKSITYTLYLASVLTFVCGLQLGTFSNITIRFNKRGKADDFIYKILWWFAVFSSFFAIKQIISGVSYGIYGNNLIDNVRFYSQYVDNGNFFSEYGIVACDVLMVYLMYRYYIEGDSSRHVRNSIIFAVALYILFVATVFNRTNILYLATIFSFFFLKKKNDFSKKRKKNLRKIILLGIGVLLLFNYIAVRTNKSYVNTTGDTWWAYYIGSEFHWLEYLVIDTNLRTYGAKSLGIIGRFFLKIGIIPNANIDYLSSMARAAGNPVSSFAYAPYSDFGWFGLLVLFFYGIIIGIIYRNHISQGGFWTMVYSTCIYQLIISFYSFQFGLSGQLYVIIILAFMLRCRRDAC